MSSQTCMILVKYSLLLGFSHDPSLSPQNMLYGAVDFSTPSDQHDRHPFSSLNQKNITVLISKLNYIIIKIL